MEGFKTGYVSIVGRPNVGKSTLLNALLQQKLSITSRKPQTTRWNLLGIKTSTSSQIIYMDTPGLQKYPKLALNRHMNREVVNALSHMDVILFVLEAGNWNDSDEHVSELISHSKGANILVLVNKIDKLKNKTDLLKYMELIASRCKSHEILPVSALKEEGIDKIETLVNQYLPIAPAFYPENQITDRNERFFAAEFIREKLMLRLSDELPYRLSVTTDEFKTKNEVIHIHATIWVEKQGQKTIVIGKEGSVLKSVGVSARKELETLFDKKINLKTWVKVKKKWADSEQALKQFGYIDSGK